MYREALALIADRCSLAQPLYSSQPEDYIIGDTIGELRAAYKELRRRVLTFHSARVGFGASSVVYEASFLPLQGVSESISCSSLHPS